MYYYTPQKKRSQAEYRTSSAGEYETIDCSDATLGNRTVLGVVWLSMSVFSASMHGLYMAVLIRLVTRSFFSESVRRTITSVYFMVSKTRQGNATRQNNETERKSRIVWFFYSYAIQAYRYIALASRLYDFLVALEKHP